MTETRQIKIGIEVRERLRELRLTKNESYSDVIARMILSHDKMENM